MKTEICLQASHTWRSTHFSQGPGLPRCQLAITLRSDCFSIFFILFFFLNSHLHLHFVFFTPYLHSFLLLVRVECMCIFEGGGQSFWSSFIYFYCALFLQSWIYRGTGSFQNLALYYHVCAWWFLQLGVCEWDREAAWLFLAFGMLCFSVHVWRRQKKKICQPGDGQEILFIFLPTCSFLFPQTLENVNNLSFWSRL